MKEQAMKKADMQNELYVKKGNKLLRTKKEKEISNSAEIPEEKKEGPIQWIGKKVKKGWDLLGDSKLDDNDFVSESRNAFKERKQVRQNRKKSVEEEIQENHKYFEDLLPISKDMEKGEAGERFSEERLIKKWEYVLEIGECEELLAELKRFSRVDDGSIIAGSLEKWMCFLEEKGIHKLAEKDDKIYISCENRAYYMNGYMFRDGVECVVEQEPWVFGDQIILKGILQEG